VADDHGRAAVVAPADVGQGAYRPVAYGGRWLGARRVIDRAPLSDDFSPVSACSLSVVPVEQALVGCHVQAGTAGHGLCGLPGSQARAGADGAGHLEAQRGGEPPGLLMPGLIEGGGVPRQGAGFVERRLAMPDEKDQSAAGGPCCLARRSSHLQASPFRAAGRGPGRTGLPAVR
jgi:hypothetical protein